MTCQPKRQVDFEVIRALVCVAARQVGQRATALVPRENRALDQDESSQDNYREKPAVGARNGNRHNASGEGEPYSCVQDLYPNENADLF